MKSFYKHDVLSENTFKKIKKIAIESLKDAEYTPSIGRWHADLELPDDLKNEIRDIARINFNEPGLEETYVQAVKYQMFNNSVPSLKKHLDKLACTHTIDLCIETTMDWGLIVLDEFYPDKENSAVFLKGDEEFHYRPQYPSSNDNDYCILLFANYGTSDHWSTKFVQNTSKELIKRLKRSRIDYLIQESD